MKGFDRATEYHNLRYVELRADCVFYYDSKEIEPCLHNKPIPRPTISIFISIVQNYRHMSGLGCCFLLKLD